MRIGRITAEEARTVRLPVLRAGLPPSAAVLDHDDDPDTHHFGAFIGDRLVGVATFFAEPCPVRPGPRDWRLRGMATLPEMRRRGAGRELVAAGVRVAVNDAGELMWCHARTSARGFYESLEFVAIGDEFHLAVAGPHYLMIKDLRKTS